MEKEEILKEVLDEIESALKDSKGIATHQRRLSFSLSLGSVSLIESYLEKINVLKSGAKINHLWMKKKKENIKKLVSDQIVCPIENIKNIDKILDLTFELERDRNEFAYGKPVSEKALKEKIELFLNLKRLIEND
jgi:murein DD-endopeptidase MepM/ murein hydrolase activator NlpD